jgi:hypothetical protein
MTVSIASFLKNGLQYVEDEGVIEVLYPEVICISLFC